MGKPRAVRAGEELRVIDFQELDNYPLEPPSDSEAVGKVPTPGSMGKDAFRAHKSQQEPSKTSWEQLPQMKQRQVLPPLQETPQWQRPTLIQTLYIPPCSPNSHCCPALPYPALSSGRAVRRLQIPACQDTQTSSWAAQRELRAGTCSPYQGPAAHSHQDLHNVNCCYEIMQQQGFTG